MKAVIFAFATIAAISASATWTLSTEGVPSGCTHVISDGNWKIGVFRYSDDGRPVGLCRARRLFYVSTSGGPAETDPFGFGYVEALAKKIGYRVIYES